ncbi:uncharacterized protein LOC118750842 [Rhagoletis pomonella]|uniref:uncharacterized protein LOC118750838 n=1 Tax=Rhagoletis pomonella TaxID=28610 RepID=UPI00177CAD9A|nr:uncharacterized protein LOC118750838 [Rhagoletis pomonella]XP_036341462.1 uncharacterized protein LOC118750842 [Rhagoletis pomonella]
MDNATDNYPSSSVLRALQQLLEIKFPSQSFTYKLLPATKKGENYIGIVYRVAVKVNNKTGPCQWSLILKIPPRSPNRRKQFFVRPCFLRESLAYEEFLPMVKGFQNSKGISKEHSFHEYAECFQCLTDEFDEAIFLEDLGLQDFSLFDRFDELRFEHVATVMRAYAKLHAVSFAIKDQDYSGGLEKFRKIQDIFEQRKGDPNLNYYFEGLKRSAVACMKAEDVMPKKVLIRFFERPFFDIFLDLIDGNKCEPYAVVCHGDCWNNNIMFKFEDAKLISLCLLDWQLLRYSSPLTDLMYFLFTCTSKEFRGLYYNDVLNVYYAELVLHINRLGSNPSKLFSREIFEKELHRIGAVGLIFAMIVLPIITIKGDDVPNLEELSEQVEKGKSRDLKESGLLSEANVATYGKRMRDVVIDCINFGYIK